MAGIIAVDFRDFSYIIWVSTSLCRPTGGREQSMIPLLETAVVTDVSPEVFASVGLGQFVLAMAMIYAVYWARERSFRLSVLTLLTVPTTVVYAQYHLGHSLFAITYGEQNQLIIISVIAGIIGLALAATVFEPEIDGELIPNERSPRTSNDG